jgi:predicted DNA-binding transcriptional regulator YafY
MKRFFPTQRFLEKTEENGVRFSVDYTQPMEILPFIRRWMPDLIIEAPQELVDVHKESLRKAIEVYADTSASS